MGKKQVLSVGSSLDKYLDTFQIHLDTFQREINLDTFQREYYRFQTCTAWEKQQMSFVVLSALFPVNFISFIYRKITGSRTSVLSKVRNCAVPTDHLRSAISFSSTSSTNDIQPFYRWKTSLFVCLHGCAVAWASCSTKQTFGQCSIFSEGTLIRANISTNLQVAERTFQGHVLPDEVIPGHRWKTFFLHALVRFTEILNVTQNSIKKILFICARGHVKKIYGPSLFSTKTFFQIRTRELIRNDCWRYKRYASGERKVVVSFTLGTIGSQCFMPAVHD